MFRNEVALEIKSSRSDETAQLPDPLENLDFTFILESACTELVSEVMSSAYIRRNHHSGCYQRSRGSL